MGKPQEMTIAEYNDLMMRDAFEMLLKVEQKVREAEAALRMSRINLIDAEEKLLSMKKGEK